MTYSKRVYLAGPMTGIKDANFPAFNTAAAALRDLGYFVFSPAENDLVRYGPDFLDYVKERFNLRATMEDDCRWICHYADAIAILPGWENSKGVKVEKALAECLGLEIIYL